MGYDYENHFQLGARYPNPKWNATETDSQPGRRFGDLADGRTAQSPWIISKQNKRDAATGMSGGGAGLPRSSVGLAEKTGPGICTPARRRVAHGGSGPEAFDGRRSR
jgi:hypothetical protein